ncbi:MAG: glycosyltransferase family 87 protein [Anaerolineales bacterium]|nr:glycosyltransferase family 87 protein [Anaerolineales bacterium]
MIFRRNLVAALLLFILGLVALLALTYANYQFSLNNPGGNDFLARWTGARAWLVDGISPYDPQVSLEAQEIIYGRPARPEDGEDVAHFVYPLHAMLFFGPFGLMDFTLARALWMTVVEVSLIALAFLSIKLVEWKTRPWLTAILVAFTLLWYHGMRTLILGQFAAVDAFLIVFALLLIRQRKDGLAGVLLALSTAKPQMAFLIVPFVLLWAISKRRRELIFGILGGSAVILVGTLALMPDWPLQMLWQILQYPSYTTTISPLAIIAGAAPAISTALSVILHGVAIVYLLFEWVVAWGKDYRWFLWVAFLTMVITNMVAFRTATTNYMMLLPVLFLVFKVIHERWGRTGMVVILAFMTILLVGLWALFIQTVDGNLEHPVMYLPLPFISLVGLWWVRWWTIRPPRTLYEELAARA